MIPIAIGISPDKALFDGHTRGVVKKMQRWPKEKGTGKMPKGIYEMVSE